MSGCEEMSEAQIVDLARECVYRFLSGVVTDPYTPGWARVLEPRDQWLAREAAAMLRPLAEPQPGPLGFGELTADALDLAPLTLGLGQPLAALRAEYDRVFGLVTPKECPPYETEYHRPSETFLRAQQLADIAGFYRAFGLEPRRSSPERPDHLALELEFVALLLTKKRLARDTAGIDPDAEEHADICDRAQRAFVRDHLAWWVPAFAAGLRRKAEGGYLHALGTVLAALIPAERHRLGLEVPSRPAQPALIERPEEQSGCASCPLRI